MKFNIDSDKFEEKQVELLTYLASRVKKLLEEKEVPEELIYDITGDLVFEVGAILDSSSVIGTKEDPVLPFITFSKSEEERENLIVSPEGSSLHEMAYGLVDHLFGVD
jgi:hypothetical protein